MATLLNDSEQLAIVAEFGERLDSGWFSLHLALQYFVESVNSFHSFVEGQVRIHESDLQEFAHQLRAFGEVEDASQNFDFEPKAEPSFEFSFDRDPLGPLHPYVVAASIDLKAVQKGARKSSFHENRVALTLQTTDAQMNRFFADLLKEIEVARIS